MEKEIKEINKDFMLTTFDNPFNPFTDFESWFKYDTVFLGYYTCSLLAKTANVSDIVSDEIREQEIDEAMDFIIKNNPTIYKKVSKEDFSNVLVTEWR